LGSIELKPSLIGLGPWEGLEGAAPVKPPWKFMEVGDGAEPWPAPAAVEPAEAAWAGVAGEEGMKVEGEGRPGALGAIAWLIVLPTYALAALDATGVKILSAASRISPNPQAIVFLFLVLIQQVF